MSVTSRVRLGHVILVTTFMSNALTCGMCYANSAYYYTYWLETFQSDQGLTAAVGSLSIGLVLLVGPLTSSLTNMFGYRAVVILGGLISSGGMVGAAYATSLHALLVGYGLVVGAGWGLALTPTMIAVTHYFHDKYHGIVLAIVSSGVGFGQFLTPVILEYLMKVYSWRGCLIIQAALNLHICVAGAVLRPTLSMKSSKETGGIFQLGIFKNWDFDILLVHCVFLAVGVSVLFVHVSYGVETFLRSDSGAVAISVLGIAGLLGRLVHCTVAKLPCVNVFHYYVISLTIGGVALLILPQVREIVSASVCTFTIGYFLAVYGATQVILIISLVELRYSLTGLGWVNLVSSVGMIAGAPLAGALHEWTEDYAVSMYLGGGVTLFSINYDILSHLLVLGLLFGLLSTPTLLQALVLARVAWRWKRNRDMVRHEVALTEQVEQGGASQPLPTDAIAINTSTTTV